MDNYVMSCGCTFKRKPVADKLLLDIDINGIYENLNLECPKIMQLLAAGESKGIFQLESDLGRNWVKKLKPENLEHMGALGALLRPGCISGNSLVRINRDQSVPIKSLYKGNGGLFYQEITSFDEKKETFFKNRIDNVIFTGIKDVYKLELRNFESKLECTLDHKLLVHKVGWTQLKDVVSGDKIAVIHRTGQIAWKEFIAKRFCGKKDTYDIKVQGPNHNFIAESVVVHNCLEAKDENGISMTEHYCRRKNKQEEIVGYHPVIDKILEPTYQVLTYQEQAILIAEAVAGFNKQEADALRKSMGKKLPEEMAKVKKMFIDGCKKTNILTDAQAEEVFGWIEKSQRYSFNKSHAISYGLIGLVTAYLKSHFTIEFFLSWLYHSMDKGNTYDEVRELIDEAKLFDITVMPPDITMMNPNFITDRKNKIWFGLSNIKGVGDAHIKKLLSTVLEIEAKLNKKFCDFTWFEMIKYVFNNLNSACVEKFIQSGALSGIIKLSRKKMLADFDIWSKLTDKEKGFILSGNFTNISNALDSCARPKKEGGGAANKKRIELLKSLRIMHDNPPTTLNDDPNWIVWHESNLLGTPLTASVLDGKDVEFATNCTCKDIHYGKFGPICVAVEIKKVRESKIKNGKNIGRLMCFISVGDSTCTLDNVIMWPEIYENNKQFLIEGNTVILLGELDKKNSSLIVKKMKQI